MREILFRGKNFDNGVWVQGYYVRLNGNKHFIYTGQSDVDCGNYYPDYYPVAAKTVGQFTGLTDKNGKKIFEGDIVQFPDCITCSCGAGDYEFTSSIGVVDYDEDVMCFYFSNRYSVEMEDFDVKNGCMTEVDVIGNIHDNPELLKGGADNEYK